MNNEIPYLCPSERVTKKIYYENVDGQYPNALSIGEKDDFDNSELVCSTHWIMLILLRKICYHI